MDDLKFTTAGDYMEDDRWILSPHGRQKHTARWVVENYENREEYYDCDLVQKWVAASKKVLEDSGSEERSSLHVGSGE